MSFYKAKIRTIEFKSKEFSEALREAVAVQTRQATREWLRAVVQRVPVYTGMARGSFLPLSRFLRVAVPINPVAQRNYGNPESGAAMSSYRFYWRRQTYTFTFNTEVPHYLINEINVGLGSPPLRHPTPWHSLDAGKIAFFNYLESNLKEKVPRILDYIVLQETYSG